MPLFTYERDIPDAPNNPSADQPDLKINTNSIDSLIAVDHYSFNQNNGGLHKQVQMPNLAAIPAGLIPLEGTLYVRIENGRSQLFYTNENSGNEYILTRTNDTNFATFGTSTAYLANHTGGWTFLAGQNAVAPVGAMMFQYGIRSSPGTSGTITFPNANYTTVFSVTAVALRTSGDRNVTLRSVSATSFNYALDSSADEIHWMAIGV